jgi:hypothetical protein
MTKPRCSTPEFVFNGLNWPECVHCLRLAWDHEQADPMADIRATAAAMASGSYNPRDYPPIMKPIT